MADTLVRAMKVCTKCGEAKPATEEFFHPNKGGAFGLRAQCRPCRKALMRAWIKLPKNAERRRATQQAYTASGAAAAKGRAWRKANPASAQASARKWRAANAEKIRVAEQDRRDRNRERQREKQRRAYRAGSQRPEVVLRRRMKSRLREALHTGKMGRSTFDLLGYTAADLKEHIERQFTDGMSWERLLSGDIHIDHIVPVCAFDIQTLDDPALRVCWGLSNLQPLWAADNWRKQGKAPPCHDCKAEVEHIL